MCMAKPAQRYEPACRERFLTAHFPFVAPPRLTQCTIRGNVRNKYGIAGGSFGDYCTHMCCEPCALSQEYTHTKMMLTGGK